MAGKPDDDIEASVATLILIMGRRLDRLYGKLSGRLLRLLRVQLELMDAQLAGMKPGTWTMTRHKAVMTMLTKGIAELTNTSLKQLTRDLSIVITALCRGSLKALIRSRRSRYLFWSLPHFSNKNACQARSRFSSPLHVGQVRMRLHSWLLPPSDSAIR